MPQFHNSKQLSLQKSQSGFTLIELLVVTALFVVVITIVGMIFMNSYQSQSRALAFETVFDQSSYLLEYMSRAIRMAGKELSCTDLNNPATCVCLKDLGYGHNYEITHSNNGIKFINSDGGCQEFYLDTLTSRLKENKDGVETFLTSDSPVAVNAFSIAVSGEDPADQLQPKVTFFLDLKMAGAKIWSQFMIQLQTTVSQRELDIL